MNLDSSWTVEVAKELQPHNINRCGYRLNVETAIKIQFTALYDCAQHAWEALRQANSKYAARAFMHLLHLPAAPVTIFIPSLIPVLNDRLGLTEQWEKHSVKNKFTNFVSQIVDSFADVDLVDLIILQIIIVSD